MQAEDRRHKSAGVVAWPAVAVPTPEQPIAAWPVVAARPVVVAAAVAVVLVAAGAVALAAAVAVAVVRMAVEVIADRG